MYLTLLKLVFDETSCHACSKIFMLTHVPYMTKAFNPKQPTFIAFYKVFNQQNINQTSDSHLCRNLSLTNIEMNTQNTVKDSLHTILCH